jgi:VCBS repeat-containing protein
MRKYIPVVIATLAAFLPNAAHAQIQPGFETPALPTNQWAEPPTGSAWHFVHNAGIANGAGSWGHGAHTGNQYAFLEQNGAAASSLYQSIAGINVDGRYQLLFYMARRDGSVGGNTGCAIDAIVNSTVVFPFTYPTGDGNWNLYFSQPFIANAKGITLTFNAPISGNDYSTLLDDVRIAALPTAIYDNYATPTNAVLTVPVAQGVMSNDYDAINAKSYLKTQGTHGTVTLAQDGSFSYHPAQNFHGFDTFTYYFITPTVTGNVTTVYVQVGDATPNVSIAANPVVGGNAATGTLTLANPAPAGAYASITCNVPNAAVSVSSIVNFAQGSKTATFPITTYAVTASTKVTFTAFYQGSVLGTGVLTVNPKASVRP